MNIALNTRFLLRDKLEGIGIYTHEIFSRVTRLLPQHTFYFYFDRTFDDTFVYSENVIPKIIFPPARHPFLWYWWFEQSIPRQLKMDQIDLFVSPDGFCSLNAIVPQIMTIHDLAFEHYPQFVPYWVKHFYKKYTPLYCNKAQKITTVSNYTKQDIIQQYQIRPEKIEVIYNGVNEHFSSVTPVDLKSNLKPESPYFIFIGAVHPRKNVLNLLKAFELFKNEKTTDLKLLIIGRKAWMNADLEEYLTSMTYKNDIVWIEQCPRTSLIYLLQNAFALVYPSLFEGFGIPLVEAMQAGVPIICSNTSSLPEIAQDAALYFSPTDIGAIKNILLQLLENDNLRKELIQKGRTRAQQFNWDISAQKMANTIQHFQIR